MELKRPVWAEINLVNLANNIRLVKEIVGNKEVTAVIKADGYGHGAREIVDTLLENGADRIAVAVALEAFELRRAGYNGKLLVMTYSPREVIRELIELDIAQGVYNLADAKIINETAKELGKIAQVHIKVDTGMGRIGLSDDQSGLDQLTLICGLDNIAIEGIFSHFACADSEDKSYSIFQLERFKTFLLKAKEKGNDYGIVHMANSAGIISFEESHFDMVRPGIMLYGLNPSSEIGHSRLKEVMSLKARIVHLKTIKKGESVSYSRRFIASRDTRVATLPLGYADGYSRLLTGKSEVLVRGKRAKVIGTICMDQLMVDVTDIERVEVGDEVVLFGCQGQEHISIDEVANHLGTINYEVVCAVSKRVPRVYVDGEGIRNISSRVG